MNIKPEFDSSMLNKNGLENPEVITGSISQLKEKDVTLPNSAILHQLLNQLEPLNFICEVYPEVKEMKKKLETLSYDCDEAKTIRKELSRKKLTSKHLYILSIEKTLECAEKNRWGLCKNNDFIYLYNGMFWSELDTDIIQNFLGKAAERLGVTKWDARFFRFKDQLFEQFLSTAYLPAPQIKHDKVLINLKNGTFEVSPEGTKLKPFDPSDFINYQLPFEYNPDAEAPIFQAYLNRVLPDPERQRVLAEFMGYVFIINGSSALKEEKTLVLFGTGANGKSVFFEISNALLGIENVSNYSLQSLTQKEGYYRAKLANKLVNYASEINNKLEASIFKQLVSGEPVEARNPFGQPFILRHYAKLIFNVNELPKDVENTNAFFRRFLIIPFDVTIPPEEQDKHLHTKIISNELSGVFNWVLSGLNRLLNQQRFSDCIAAKKALEQYKTESNSVSLYLEENGYEKSYDDHCLIKNLYSEYKEFCHEDGMKPFSKKNFKKQLESLNYSTGREPGTGQNIAFVSKNPQTSC